LGLKKTLQDFSGLLSFNLYLIKKCILIFMGALSSIGFNSGIGMNNQFGNLYSNNNLSYNPFQNSSGINPGFNNNLGLYGNNLGLGMPRTNNFGLGSGFNNTGLLIAAFLIPSITTFITELCNGLSNSRNKDNSDHCGCFKNSSNQYDREVATENFDDSFEI
jgi:hypothetical protein